MSFASALGAYTGTVEGTLVLSATFTAATIAGTQSLYLPGLTAPATNPVALTVSYGRINVLPTTDDGNLIVGLVGNCIITPINTAAQVAPLPVAALAAEANALVLVPGSANGLYRIQIFA